MPGREISFEELMEGIPTPKRQPQRTSPKQPRQRQTPPKGSFEEMMEGEEQPQKGSPYYQRVIAPSIARRERNIPFKQPPRRTIGGMEKLEPPLKPIRKTTRKYRHPVRVGDISYAELMGGPGYDPPPGYWGRRKNIHLVGGSIRPVPKRPVKVPQPRRTPTESSSMIIKRYKPPKKGSYDEMMEGLGIYDIKIVSKSKKVRWL